MKLMIRTFKYKGGNLQSFHPSPALFPRPPFPAVIRKQASRETEAACDPVTIPAGDLGATRTLQLVQDPQSLPELASRNGRVLCMTVEFTSSN